MVWLALLPLLAVYWWCAKAFELGFRPGQILRFENFDEQTRALFGQSETPDEPRAGYAPE